MWEVNISLAECTLMFELINYRVDPQHTFTLIHEKCSTEQLPVYFNCASFWIRPVGLFDWQLQAHMRHNFHFRAVHIHEIYRIDIHIAHEHYHIWDFSLYHGKHTHTNEFI